jgi:hypothetical protein
LAIPSLAPPYTCLLSLSFDTAWTSNNASHHLFINHHHRIFSIPLLGNVERIVFSLLHCHYHHIFFQWSSAAVAFASLLPQMGSSTVAHITCRLQCIVSRPLWASYPFSYCLNYHQHFNASYPHTFRTRHASNFYCDTSIGHDTLSRPPITLTLNADCYSIVFRPNLFHCAGYDDYTHRPTF